MSNAVLKRLERLEQEIASKRRPVIVNCWTRSLAQRIEAAFPPGHGATLVHLTFSDAAAEEHFEAELLKDNEKEATRLNRLLDGQVPEY